MKKGVIAFLQVIVVLIGIGMLAALIRFPLTEGRAVSLDLISIYSDPFILYGYAASIPFFIALFQVFKLLGHIAQGNIFSLSAVKALRAIKYCAIIVATSIVMAVVYIRFTHHINDDPAGFIALGILTTFISLVVAALATIFGKRIQRATHI